MWYSTKYSILSICLSNIHLSEYAQDGFDGWTDWKKVWIMIWIISLILVTFNFQYKLYDALFTAVLKHWCKLSRNFVKTQILVWLVWVKAWNSLILTRFLVIRRVWSMCYIYLKQQGFENEHRVVCAFFFILIIKIEDLQIIFSLMWWISTKLRTLTILLLSIKSQPLGHVFGKIFKDFMNMS